MLSLPNAPDGVQVVTPEELRDAPLDGDGEGIVPRPEGDNSVADGGPADDVRRELCRRTTFIAGSLGCFFRWHFGFLSEEIIAQKFEEKTLKKTLLYHRSKVC